MNRLLHASILLGALVNEISARVPIQPTKRNDIEHDAPAATPAPEIHFADLRQLGKRQNDESSSSTIFTVTVAPDETCGFLSGSAGVPITCSNKQTCMWEEEYIGAVFCGLGADSESYNRCLDKEQAEDEDLCDDVCQSNVYNLLCTASSAPYCRVYAYPGGVRGYACHSSSLSRPQSVSFTYRDQDNRELLTTTVGDAVSEEEPSSTESSSTEPSDDESTETESDKSEPTDPKDDDDDSGDDEKKDDGPNIGAIVGGAIGGFTGLALIVLGLVWWMRREKRRKAAAAAAAGTAPGYAPVQQITPNAMPPQVHGSPPPPEPYKEMSSPAVSDWRSSTMTGAPTTATSPAPMSEWSGYGPPGQNAYATSPQQQPVPPYQNPQPVVYEMGTDGREQNVAYEMSGDSHVPQPAPQAK